MKIHFIAIGGSVMHNLAIALKNEGFDVSGSDDVIFEPSWSRLHTHGLLPTHMGWDAMRITPDIEAVIVGMHAHTDNPELRKAQELGLKIFSFPEYIYNRSLNKERIVVAGSHGKTTITAMIMHVLQYCQYKFDYVIGAYVHGFDSTIRLSQDAPIIVVEGDEYHSSPTNPSPKFLTYQHHLAVISGVAWDHANVYKTPEEYILPFQKLIESTPKAGMLVVAKEDKTLKNILSEEKNKREDIHVVSYEMHPHKIKNNAWYIKTDEGNEVEVSFFGEHNMYNLNAAKTVCKRIGVRSHEFYEAIQSFKGAKKRLEVVGKNEVTHFFLDFAHAPSKVNATIQAVKKFFPKRKLFACIELHSYSSLNKNFISQYKNTMKAADIAAVYYNPHNLSIKRLEPLSFADLVEAFGRKDLHVFTDSSLLEEFIYKQNWKNQNLLMMSSGNFNALDMQEISRKILAV